MTGRYRTPGLVPAPHQHDPRGRPELGGQCVEQIHGGAVHQMRLVDLDDGWDDQCAPEQPQHDLVQLRGAGTGGQLLNLNRRRELDVEHDRDQRHPGRQPPIGQLDLRSEPIQHLRVRRVRASPEHLAKQVPPGRVRRVARVYLAREAQRDHSLGEAGGLG
jgi:hypothetical protein